jgi:hypothetical protein
VERGQFLTLPGLELGQVGLSDYSQSLYQTYRISFSAGNTSLTHLIFECGIRSYYAKRRDLTVSGIAETCNHSSLLPVIIDYASCSYVKHCDQLDSMALNRFPYVGIQGGRWGQPHLE